MASPPESTPSSNKTNSTTPPANESSKEQSSNSSSPSSSPSTSSSPPPKSPTPPSPQESPPPHSPPPQSSPPPPKESPSSPPPESQSPPPLSPPPQQQSKPASPPPNTPTHSPPPQSTTPLSPPLATTAPATPTPNSTAATTTTPHGVFSPPPPISALSPPSSPTEKLHSSSSSHKSSPAADTQSTINVAIIAGITAASVLLIALAILIVACLLKKKKKPHYRGPPKGCDPYYATPTKWHSPQGQVVQIAPPPGVMGTPMGGGGGWAAQPHMGGDGGWGAPPPPNFQNTSSEFSSSYSAPMPGHTPPMQGQSPNVGLGLSKMQFSYDELAAATGRFSQANLLGQGGFGYVHKGVLPNGQMVAVKSLKTGSGQGEREFQAEVEIISRVHHRHLVSLVGYCIADGQRMLVYEFVPNKTMEFHLHGKSGPVMDWATRLRIALGSAKGLAYLHEDCHPKIIHRDIKAANILLDDKFEAMVADFGLAKLSADNNTHVSTRVMGTFGYLAPEYASSGKLTEKSDVFSFGVMLLELITGRRPVDATSKFMEHSLVDWARPLLTKAIDDGNYEELVDPRLEENFDMDEMARMAACAAACIRHSARRRPKMTQIVRTLDGDSSLDDLNEGGKAGQGTSSNGSPQVYDTDAYNADMMKFRQMVMSSQEFLSSEYGGTTSEYAPSSSSGDSRETGIHSGAQRQKL